MSIWQTNPAMRLLIILSSAAVCYKWGDWRNWKKYYPTILFVICGDLIYNFVFHDFTLWRYTNWPNHTFVNLMYMFLVYPSVVITYLTRYPRKRSHAVLYVLGWAIFGVLFERIAVSFGNFTYENSWNIWWSSGFFLMGFMLIKLHYHHPIITWATAFFFLFLYMFLFHIPFAGIK